MTVYEKLSKFYWKKVIVLIENKNPDLFLIFSIMFDKFPAWPIFEVIQSNIHFNETIRWITKWKLSKYDALSGPYFPAFGPNTEIYGGNLHIQSKYGKIRTRKNSVFGHFSRCECMKLHKEGFIMTRLCIYSSDYFQATDSCRILVEFL